MSRNFSPAEWREMKRTFKRRESGLFVPPAHAGAVINPYNRSSPPPAFDQYKTSNANATSYTFTAFNTGTAAANRLLIVGLAWEGAVAAPITTVKFHVPNVAGDATGTTATRVYSSGTNVSIAYYQAVIPTGTTCDVVIALSSTAERFGCALWQHYTDDVVPIATKAANGASPSTLADVYCKSGGLVLAGMICTSGSAGNSATWGGAETLTERVDAVLESAQSVAFYDAIITADSLTQDIVITAVAATALKTVALSWRGPGVTGDPFWTSTILRCKFDGTDAATSSTDVSNVGRTLTFNGDAQIDTAQSVFGSSSLLCDGTGDYVSAPDAADLTLNPTGAEPFTIEFWVRWAVASGNQDIISKWNTTGNQRGWTVAQVWGTNNLIFRYSADGTASTAITLSGATPFVINTWFRLAFDWDGTTLRMYINEAFSASTGTQPTGGFKDSTAILAIGAMGTPTNYLNGWIDDVRITSGVARYARAAGTGYDFSLAALPVS